MRRALAAVAFCVFALALVNARQGQQPTFRGGVDVVAVDVHVVDGTGRPVPDLKPDDFSITVDGKPRAIVTADYVAHGVNTGAATPTPAKPAVVFSTNVADRPATPARTIIIVVDHENIASGHGRAAIDAVSRFLDRMQPDDRVGLMLLTRANLAIEPTTDRAAIRKALPGVIGHYVRADVGSPYTLGQVEAFAFEHDKRQWAEVLTRECYEKFSGSRLQVCLAEMENYARSTIADSRRRQVDSMRSLVALFNALAQVPGPKTVLLISEQLPVAPFVAETPNFNAEARPLAQAAARARVNTYVLQLDVSQADPERRMMPESAHADVDMASFGLETVTTVTGGRRMMVSGMPEAAFERIAVEISGYYVLGFRSEAADRDGKAHTIKVSVRRKGVDVRAREMFSYAAATATGDKNATDLVNRLLRALDTEAGIPMSVTTYSLVDAAGGAQQMRVLISAEIDRGATKELPLTVGYALTDAGGKNAGANVEQVTLQPAVDHPDRPLVYTAAALVPPGSYSLRVAAADSALRGGSVVHTFEARPTEAGATRLSELVVLDPYVAEAGKPRPSVSALASGQLRCYVEAYGPAQSQAAVTARLELADAADAAARASAPFDVQPPDANGRMRLSGELPLDDIAPGDYVARAIVLADGNPVGRVSRPVRVIRGAAPATAPVTPPPAQPQPTQPAAAPAAQPPAPPASQGTAAKYPTPAANVAELMPRVAAYIKEYAEQMSLVIGIEHYGQWLQREDYGSSEQMRMGGSVTSPSASRAISRQLVSEFALVRSGDNWDGFRNVYEVDGKPVPDAKDRMVKLFTQTPAAAVQQSRQLGEESSRYNLGSLRRNFNVPTVALVFLSAANQSRFKFSKDKDDVVNGVKVWKVKYEETTKPTMVRTSAGKDMPVKGEAWIDPVEGRVLKTHMQIDSEMGASSASKGNIGEKIKTTASITATYAFEPRLGILVPTEMLETYEAPMRSQFTGEDNMTKVNCRATYSDFKRFETSGRLVPPK